jgi:transposase
MSIARPLSQILVKDRHRSREFIEFLKLLDAAYPARTAIKLILDNHSAHISRETKAWLADQPVHRFEFTFTPNHGSWLNLVEGFFSKLARPAAHPRRLQARAQGSPHGRRGLFQPRSRRSHLDLQARCPGPDSPRSVILSPRQHHRAK